MTNLILASKSKVRKSILEESGIECTVHPSNVDEEPIKESLLNDGASPEIVSKNLAEIKANKVSEKFFDKIVIGADSVIDLNNQIISKPNNRDQAMQILKKLNGKSHSLVSSVCISRNGSMIWNHTDKAILKMKNMTNTQLENYLKRISDENLFAYNVYQIEGEGKNLFEKIEGEKSTIMGLPIIKIKEYLMELKC